MKLRARRVRNTPLHGDSGVLTLDPLLSKPLCTLGAVRFSGELMLSFVGSYAEVTGLVEHHTGFFSKQRGVSKLWFVTLLFSLPCSIWRGPNVNCVDSTGYTPLHHAALNGHK